VKRAGTNSAMTRSKLNLPLQSPVDDVAVSSPSRRSISAEKGDRPSSVSHGQYDIA
jgi:hypothetical protein